MDNWHFSSNNRLTPEVIAEQNDRLTNKHILTLSFLQNMANENKQLKARIAELEQSKHGELNKMTELNQQRMQQIQIQSLNSADEINAELANKHQIEAMEIVSQTIDHGKQYEEKISKLKDDISGLQKTNRELLEKLGTLTEAEESANLLRLELEEIKMEMAILKEENQCLRNSPPTKHPVSQNKSRNCASGTKLPSVSSTNRVGDLEQLREMRHQNSHMHEELLAALQSNSELKAQKDRLERQLQEMQGNKDLDRMIQLLQQKITKYHAEKAASNEKIEAQEKLCQDLYTQLEQTQQDLITAQHQIEMTIIEYNKLLTEYQLQHAQSAKVEEKLNFRDFVVLKRELNSLRDENEILKQQKKKSLNSLPCLTADQQMRYTKAPRCQLEPLLALPPPNKKRNIKTGNLTPPTLCSLISPIREKDLKSGFTVEGHRPMQEH